MSPACAAKPNSVHETCPDRWRVPTPEEKKELGFVQVSAPCLNMLHLLHLSQAVG